MKRHNRVNDLQFKNIKRNYLFTKPMIPAADGKLASRASRIARPRAKLKPPPALSPVITIFFGSKGSNLASFGGFKRYK
jgi:hypothetical protein